MGKKEKKTFALEEEFQAISGMVPKLQTFIKIHKEIAAGYQKYRKNGGEAIPGVEKYLGCCCKEQCAVPAVKTKKPEPVAESEATAASAKIKKAKKKKVKAKVKAAIIK